MSAFPAMTPAARTALAEHVGRMKHDLGKYIAFQTRWVAPDAPLAERRAALDTDLRQTRRSPEGERDANEVWATFRPVLYGEAPLADGTIVDLRGDPDVSDLTAAMADVAAAIVALAAGNAGETEVNAGAGAASRAADAIRRMHNRLSKGS